MPMKNKQNRKTAKRIIIVALVLVSVMLLFGGVYAKYLYSNTKQNTVNTPAFYFESDLLSKKGVTHTVNPGTEEIKFTLKNHADKLRVSTDNIFYTIEVTGGATLSSSSGELSGGVASDAEITLSGLTDGGTYTVTAVGAAGFSEMLTATFTVITDPQKMYKYVDASNDAYVLLTVWTENAQGTINVTVPEGLIPDNTCEGLEEMKTVDGAFSDTLVKYSSKTYRFFKGKDYGGNASFTVKLGDTAVPDGILK